MIKFISYAKIRPPIVVPSFFYLLLKDILVSITLSEDVSTQDTAFLLLKLDFEELIFKAF